MNEYKAYIALNMLSGVGPVRVKALLEHFTTVDNIFTQSIAALCKVQGIGRKVAECIVHWQQHIDLEEELKKIDQAGVTVLTPKDELYPDIFHELHAPPLCLYVRGNPQVLNELNSSIAVVGSRRMTMYGKTVTERIVTTAVLTQWTVVSGMAQGIDTIAHTVCVDHQGITIAILGSGLARIYPQDNCALAAKIAEKGAVISEFPMTYPPDRRSFPMRNRLIAALSRGVLLVEAGLNSGSLITANLALEQGKTVFAVPGRIDSVQSQGCHKLLKEGARLVESFDDVLEEFRFLPLFENNHSYGKTPYLEKKEQVKVDPKLKLTDLEQKIFEFIDRGECSIDQIVHEVQHPLGQTFATLIQMETKRLIQPLPGKRYAVIK